MGDDGTCNCQSGMFCNSDIGLNKGSCESCDGHKDLKSCEADGLPDLGVKECKLRCLADGQSVWKITSLTATTFISNEQVYSVKKCDL